MCKLLLTLCLLCSMSACWGVEVLTFLVPGLHEETKSGLYDQIISKIPSAGITSLPPMRASREFERCVNCCISPVNKDPNFYDYDADVFLESEPMGVVEIYTFTRSGDKPLSTLADLNGKSVGVRLGFTYGRELEHPEIGLQYVPTLEQNVKKLLAGRLDAIIAYTPDAYTVFKQMNMPILPHDKANPLWTHNDSVVCKRTPATEAFIPQLNAIINSR